MPDNESDLLKWVGVRPVRPVQNIYTSMGKFDTVLDGVTRTQVIKRTTATAGTVILHTVTAGKKLFLTTFACATSPQASTVLQLTIRDSSDALVTIICELRATAETAPSQSLAFPMPLVIPAGYDIVLTSGVGFVIGAITGWEEST